MSRMLTYSGALRIAERGTRMCDGSLVRVVFKFSSNFFLSESLRGLTQSPLNSHCLTRQEDKLIVLLDIQV